MSKQNTFPPATTLIALPTPVHDTTQAPARTHPSCGHDRRMVERDHRRALISELTPCTRALHVDVLRQTMADGVPVSPAALAVVLSAHDERAPEPLQFTEAHVNELLWVGIAEFCAEYDLEMPHGCREALHAALAVATLSGALHPESDDTVDLFRPFHSFS